MLGMLVYGYHVLFHGEVNSENVTAISQAQLSHFCEAVILKLFALLSNMNLLI